MNRVTLDASSVVKWLFPKRDEEAHKNQALRLLGDLQEGRCSILQPPHWLAETCAVAARLDMAIARRAVELLWAMECPVLDTLEVYSLGMELAAALDHHLFDTLYHAVALCEPGTCLVTADERYYLKAKHKGSIILLSEYDMH
jgi:predicted nucleic acid-binding protein